ncbi:MAG: hypothetical protein MUF14_10390 [Hyphomonadaceae bacterium]|jgi:hypothetical protein|nr:hypothetical protein [Hyphomonadaceae bacterium]
MKFRFAGILQFVCLIGIAGGLYGLKTVADGKRDALESLEAQIAEDRRAIRMLEADLAYFSQPQRLEAAAQGLELSAPDAARIVTVAELDRVAPQAGPATDAVGAAAATADTAAQDVAIAVPQMMGAR